MVTSVTDNVTIKWDKCSDIQPVFVSKQKNREEHRWSIRYLRTVEHFFVERRAWTTTTISFLDEEDVLTLLSTNFSRLMYQLALLLAALNYCVLTFIELIRWSEPLIHCDKQMIHPIACQAFFVFDIVLASFLDRTAEKWTGKGWKKKECHAGKVDRVEWNLGSLQRGHSLCTLGTLVRVGAPCTPPESTLLITTCKLCQMCQCSCSAVIQLQSVSMLLFLWSL